jgi:hypothetical protein
MLTQRMVLTFPRDVTDALYEVATQEFRHPKEQAALFIVEALRQRGVLEEKRAAGHPVAAQTRERAG